MPGMKIGILKENDGEKRISMLPEAVKQLIAGGAEVLVEEKAGLAAAAPDEGYAQAGARVASRKTLLDEADLLLSIHLPNDLSAIPSGKWLCGTFQPLFRFDAMQQLAEKNITVFSMDMLPRTTRAQSMDVLSSQANIAGYRAVLLAAHLYPRYFPMLMTAAGSVPPAKMLILGAGVAGLQAIATGRRLGAVVEVFDTRPAVKEEVMSLGAKFVEVEGAADASSAGGYAVEQSEDFKRRQQERIAESIRKADVVITTAQIPGKAAPLLVTEDMIRSMRPGSVIVDLAAATGGNTAQTKNNETLVVHEVTIAGYSNLAGEMPFDASRLYGKNLLNFFTLFKKENSRWEAPFEDELIKGTCITLNGAVVHERIQSLLTQ